MTVGLPGSGIGGVFYLISALLMPVHAGARSATRVLGLRAAGANEPRWDLVWRQFAIAVGILASLWTAGWLLALLLVSHPAVLGQAQTTEIGKKLPNVLRAGAILVSLSTLAAVLVTVQIARLVVRAGDRRVLAERASALKIAAGLLLMILVPKAAAQGVDSVATAPMSHMQLADRAFDDEDTATARREYEAALRENPDASRAMYRLGKLARSNARVAEGFFRRYTKEEVADAWGWTALGDALAAQKKYRDALDAYGKAFLLAPSERDVVIGRARVLAAAGRTDESIRAYESWTSAHAADAEAQRELAAQQRRAGRYRESDRSYRISNSVSASEKAQRGSDVSRGFAAPALEIYTSGSRDSEENQSARAGGTASVQVGDRVRLNLSGGKRWLSGFSDVTVEDGSIGFVSRPLAALRFELSGGVSRPHSTITFTDTIPSAGTGTEICTPVGNGNGRGNGRNRTVCTPGTPPPGTIIQTESASSANLFVGAIRGVLRKPGGRSSLDLRVTRALLDATPVLVINRVTRSEFAGRADVEVIPRVKLRFGGRAGSYDATGDDNTRTSVLGGVAVAATDAIEVSGVFQRLTFSHATTSGYFAPQAAQLAELGSYAELESENGTVLALDGGVGAQRLQEFSAAMGKWEPSFRLFASLDVPFRPGSALHLEMDSYDSRLGSDAPSSTSSWKSVSLSASLRLALH